MKLLVIFENQPKLTMKLWKSTKANNETFSYLWKSTKTNDEKKLFLLSISKRVAFFSFNDMDDDQRYRNNTCMIHNLNQLWDKFWYHFCILLSSVHHSRFHTVIFVYFLLTGILAWTEHYFLMFIIIIYHFPQQINFT